MRSLIVVLAPLSLLVACDRFNVTVISDAGQTRPSLDAASRDAPAPRESAVSADAGADRSVVGPGPGDAGTDTRQASESGPADAGVEGGVDAGGAMDAGEPPDAGTAPVDAGRDARPDAAACTSPTSCIEVIVPALGQAGVLMVSGGHVFVADQAGTRGYVYQCPSVGCSSPTLLGEGQATGLGTDGTNLYWNDFQNNHILRCAIGGCNFSPTTIATQPLAEGVSSDGTNLFWATMGSIVTCRAPACASPTTLVSGSGQTVVTTDAQSGFVYWSTSSEVDRCAATGCNSQPTRVSPPGSAGEYAGEVYVHGGAAYLQSGAIVVECAGNGSCVNPKRIGSSYQPYGIAADDAYVYWLDGLIANVYRCPVSGCAGTAEVFVDQTDIDPSGETGTNVALDADYVYWADANNVFRKHK